MSSLPAGDHEEQEILLNDKGSRCSTKLSKDVHAVLAITVTYGLLIFPRFALAAAISDMKDRLGLNNGDLSTLIVAMGASYGFGKAFNGVIVDCVDARYALWSFMFLSIISCFGWSFGNTTTSMYPYISVCMFCQSGMWPCMTKLIYNWFDTEAYSMVFSCLSIASRTGSFFALLILGAVVAVTDWRWTIRAASIANGMGFIFAVMMMRNRAAPPMRKDHQPKTGESGEKGCCNLCTRISKSARFWFVFVAMANMTVLAGLASYTALWLTDVFRHCTDTDGDNCNSVFNSGYASIFSSLVPLGIVCSLIYGLFFVDDAHQMKEAKTSVLLLVCVTLSVVVFASWTTMVEAGKRPKEDPLNWVGALAVFIFFYGLGVGYPYYIPPNVYVVKVGGADSATLSAILDIGGLVLSTAFAYFGPALSEAEGVSETAMTTWRYTFYAVTVVAIIATAAMFGFQYLNLKALKNTNQHVEKMELAETKNE